MKTLSIENLVGIGKKIVTVGAVSAATVYLTLLGMNHFIHNTEYRSRNRHTVTRAEGAFGSTEFTRDFDYEIDEVQQSGLGSYKAFLDGRPFGEHDGKVDIIQIIQESWNPFSSGAQKNILSRYIDYWRFPEEFDKADRLLAETKERFGIQDEFPNPKDLYRELPQGLIV